MNTLPKIKTTLKVRKWYDRWYTSQEELWEAYRAGLVSVQKDETSYGANYQFTTLGGLPIGAFYKDSGYGFSSQAYGVQIPESLVSQSPFFF